jgi:t-SNARE complex subunit (syntaxin)
MRGGVTDEYSIKTNRVIRATKIDVYEIVLLIILIKCYLHIG